MVMYKVTNSGFYKKVVLKVRGKAVFYIRVNSLTGEQRTQKELLHTKYHDWTDSKDIAKIMLNVRLGR